jgi:hypothetical protein
MAMIAVMIASLSRSLPTLRTNDWSILSVVTGNRLR